MGQNQPPPSEMRFAKVDGGKTTTLRLVAVILAPGLKWKAARITTKDGTEVFRFDAVTSRAALPPGDYVVEVDGNKIPFPAPEGEVLEIGRYSGAQPLRSGAVPAPAHPEN